ncbi:MAG: hypothetical protein GXO92_09000 [FCB group bacterium]|nr:hypothetical protein [FCB group bacterium]
MKHMYKLLLTGILLIVPAFVTAQAEAESAEKPTAAVLDFQGLGITNMEAVALTQRLAGELVNTGALIIVERNQIKEILEEQGFQQSGCTTAECAVEIGALLGVQKMISGSFGKVGETYTIEAKMFSVATGQTERAVNKTYKGEVDGLITQVELVAWELVGLDPPDDLKERAGISVEKPKVAKKGGKRLLFWTGVLAAAGGGAYYYLMTQQGEKQLSDLQLPPEPPARPKLMTGGGR